MDNVLSWKTKNFGKGRRGWVLTNRGRKLGSIVIIEVYDIEISDFRMEFKSYLGGKFLNQYRNLVAAKRSVEDEAGVNCQFPNKHRVHH